MDPKEQRKYERLSFLNPKEEENHIIFNLSTMGAFFAGQRRMEPGQTISLEVTLPRSMGKLLLPGEIRWTKEISIGGTLFYLAGMQFSIKDVLTAETLQAYLQFLEREKNIRENRSLAITNLDEFSRNLGGD